jgi:hypothetical protein
MIFLVSDYVGEVLLHDVPKAIDCEHPIANIVFFTIEKQPFVESMDAEERDKYSDYPSTCYTTQNHQKCSDKCSSLIVHPGKQVPYFLQSTHN